MFDRVVTGLNQSYQGVRPAMQFREDAAPNTTDYHVDWVLAQPKSSGEIAHFESNVPAAVYNFINTKAATLNSAQVAFGIAQVLSKTRMMPTFNTGTVFVQQLFKNAF